MGSAFHQLCPRYSGTLTPTAPTAIRLWETFTFYLVSYICMVLSKITKCALSFFLVFFVFRKIYRYRPSGVWVNFQILVGCFGA